MSPQPDKPQGVCGTLDSAAARRGGGPAPVRALPDLALWTVPKNKADFVHLAPAPRPDRPQGRSGRLDGEAARRGGGPAPVRALPDLALWTVPKNKADFVHLAPAPRPGRAGRAGPVRPSGDDHELRGVQPARAAA